MHDLACLSYVTIMLYLNECKRIYYIYVYVMFSHYYFITEATWTIITCM